MNPKPQTPAETAQKLTREIRRPITEAMILKDIADGMPLDADGSVNYLLYAAWLVKEGSGRGH